MKAIWNGVAVAESDDAIFVDGRHYFPLASLRMEHFRPSETQTTCLWKGIASYYDVVVDGKVAKDAAFFYATPSQAAALIAGRVAFWRGVRVEG